MTAGNLTQRQVVWAVLVVLSISTVAAVFHVELDCNYRPNCPACQLQHSPGTHTSSVSSATLVVAPAAVRFVPDFEQPRLPQLLATLELVPRSPPLPRV